MPKLEERTNSKEDGTGRRLDLDEEIRRRARPLRSDHDLSGLIEAIQNKKVVMLGESSHGTKEFYQWRHWISRELIEKHGFNFIAVEGDWPPCYQVNQFVRGSHGLSAHEVLKKFNRWPTWMWANREVEDLISWLQKHNAKQTSKNKVGFYGLDVYSLFESIDEVLQQTEKWDTQLSQQMREWYACFDPFQRNEKAYVKSLMRFAEGCEESVLQGLRRLLDERLRSDPEWAQSQEPLFDAIQNARIVKNAEAYYRAMIDFDDNSWNVRDQHMMETLISLMSHHGRDTKAIVWEHNTHIGDYRATDMVEQGDINIGGLAREHWGNEAVALVGFGTYEGTVVASNAWAGKIEKMSVPPAKPGSYEAHFHSAALEMGTADFYLLFDETAKTSELAQKRGHRAIGVVYDPRQERWGNYVPTSLAERYDAFVYFDRTEGVNPLKVPVAQEEVPETYPDGL